MKNYIVKSYHHVEIDNYETGLGDYVNSFDMKAQVVAENPTEAINKYLLEVLFYNLDFKNCEINPEDKTQVQTSCLVDADNSQPTKDELMRWEKGELVLYCNQISMSVCELIDIEF